MTSRWPIVLAVLLGAFTTGCDQASPGPCECPNSEAIVSSIDWMGDGLPADVFVSGESYDGPRPGLGVDFTRFDNLDDAQAAVDSLYTRLQAAGLVPTPPLPAGQPNISLGFDLEGATVIIPPPLVENDPETATEERVEHPFYLSIEVEVTAGDNSAGEALQPLVDALGTLD